MKFFINLPNVRCNMCDTYFVEEEDFSTFKSYRVEVCPKCKTDDYLMDLIQKMTDNINPSHYRDSKIECIDAIKASLSTEGFHGYLKGSIQKYLWRYTEKNGQEDLLKAQWFMDRLVTEGFNVIEQEKEII